MKNIDAGQMTTVFANLGVLVGLVFVGFEVRQNTLASRAEGSRSITEIVNVTNAGIYSDPVLAELVVRGKQDISSLNPVERERFDRWTFSRLNTAEYILDLERGGVSDLNFKYVDAVVADFHNSPGLRVWIRQVADGYVGSEELLLLLLDGAEHQD